MDLNQTRVFVEVVRAGGFAAAGRRLGLPKSTVSARVQALEARLGAQLLKRSTRQLSLTSEGRSYFDVVASAVDALVGAEAATSAPSPMASATICPNTPIPLPTADRSASRRPTVSARPMVNSRLGPGTWMNRIEANTKAISWLADDTDP